MAAAPDNTSARIPEAPRTQAGYYEVRPLDVLSRNGLCIIDVREDEGELLSELGHIHGAYHLPASRFAANALGSLGRDTPLVFVCQNGFQSRRCAVDVVREGHFHEVYLLVGGMIRWCAEERPVARGPTFRHIDAPP